VGSRRTLRLQAVLSGAGERRWTTCSAELPYALNWLIWIVFAVEFVALLIVTPDRSRWLLRHPLKVAIVLFTAPFMPASLQSARVLRVLRVVRVFRAAQVAQRLFSLDGLRFATLLVVVTALGGGAAFANVEGREISTWDGVWWAITTMTTVGYGDISPQSDAGRTVAIVVMLVGIGFVALLTGSVAQRFLEGETRQEVDHEAGKASSDLTAELSAIRERLEMIERRLARQ
jgi:voltage-gated potassium channel